MKRLFSILILSIIGTTVFAQTIDQRRKIEVTGVAEQEVTPDIINVSISLKEYFKDNNTKNRVSLVTLEKQLTEAVAEAGVKKEDFMIENVSAYTTYQGKKKNSEFLESRQYRLKLSNLYSLSNILDKVDSKGVQSSNISSYDYSKIEALKKDLKIKAIQAAKEKGTYLASALGDQLGKALEVQEINNEYFPQPVYRSNMLMAKSMDMAESAPEIDFKKIKLSYQMRVIFELK